jgi:ketosteroid isomerase-like protein
MATVRSAYETYESKDLETFLALLDDEFEFRQSELVPWGGSYRGREGMIEFFGRITTHVDSVVDPEEFVEADDHVVVIGRSRGTAKATGQPFNVRAVHVWQVRDGRLLRLDVYLDTPAMMEALAA